MVSEASGGEQSGHIYTAPRGAGEREVLQDGKWGPLGRAATEGAMGHGSRRGVGEAGTPSAAWSF